MELYDVYAADNTASSTILIVDDDPINRSVLRKLFSASYSIKEAVNGREGLTQILDQRNHFCAIFLDVVMPEMDGIEVLQNLKRFGVPEKIPVFLITSETNEWIVREAYELGVMDVIRKPVVSYVVLRRVHSVVELFEARKRLNNVVAFQHAELREQADKIIQLNRGMIEALATAIEFRNEESGGHVQRISEITRFFLENTDFGDGLSDEDINNITLASIMHDVGKITIPDAILAKPGRLTPEEFEVMKTHTTKGVTILESIPQLRDSGIYSYARDIARHHHERWDGGGYPDGLAGEEITPWAQVVSVADVYDALSCKRIYKASYSRQTVLDMIRSGECGAFNPDLLKSFFSIEEQLSRMYQSLPEAQNF